MSLPYNRSKTHRGSSHGGRTFRLWGCSNRLVKYGVARTNDEAPKFEQLSGWEPNAIFDSRSVLAVPYTGSLIQGSGGSGPSTIEFTKHSTQDYLTTFTPMSYGGECLSNLLSHAHGVDDVGTVGVPFNFRDAVHPEMFQYSTWDFCKLRTSISVRRIMYADGPVVVTDGTGLLLFRPDTDLSNQLVNQNNADVEFITWADPTNRAAVFAANGWPIDLVETFLQCYNNNGKGHEVWSALVNRGIAKRMKHSHGRPAVLTSTVRLKKPSFSWNTFFSAYGGSGFSSALLSPITSFFQIIGSSAPSNAALNPVTPGTAQMPVDLMDTRTGVGLSYIAPLFPATWAGLSYAGHPVEASALPQYGRFYIEYECRTSLTVKCRDLMQIPLHLSAEVPADLGTGPLLRQADLGMDGLNIEESSDDEDSVMVLPPIVPPKRAHTGARASPRR